MTPSERRREPRVNVPLAIKYRLVGELMGMWREGRLTNLGVGGVRLTSPQSLEPGINVELEIGLPSRQERHLFIGQVIWQKEVAPGLWEHGVAFLEVTLEKQAELDALVQFLRRA